MKRTVLLVLVALAITAIMSPVASAGTAGPIWLDSASVMGVRR